MRIAITASLATLVHLPHGRAADIDPREASRTRLNTILSVLQLRSSATSNACVSALEEMHSSEDQLKTLSEATDEPTESQRHANRQDDLAVARDVLESDVDNAITACGPDAKTVCNHPPAGGDRQCGTLAR